MPKATSITKEIIIDAAFEFVRKEGFASLSARNISKKIGCSTQPIYWVYKNMDDLKQEVTTKIISYLNKMLIEYRKTGKPFLDYGLGYIYIAHTEPALFKAIYIDNILNLKMTDIIHKKEVLNIMKQDACTANISDDKIIEIATKAWFLVHGIASLIVCGMLVYDEGKIEKILDFSYNTDSENPNMVEITKEDVIKSRVFTAKQQAKLTPNAVLQMLKNGNKEYVKGNLTVRNNSQRLRDAASGQYPKAVVVSCLDSRVPVEDIFHQGIGDLFVARVAGNFVNEDILGSLEFACEISGAKLVVVLGHENCGAIKSAIDNVKLGNITAMLSKIQPAVNAAAMNFKGNKTSDNAAFVEAVCNHNVSHAMNEIRTKSGILKEMEKTGAIMIVGGVYHLETGRVEFFG